MLSQYLVSNQNLELNSSFKVYLKILSVRHMKNQPIRRIANKRKFTGRIHVGIKTSQRYYSPKWAYEFLMSNFTNEQQDFLINKCLLIATILSFLQHSFFQSKGSDSRYLVLCNLKSKVKKRRDQAFSLLQNELNEMFCVTKLQRTGPYELKSTLKLLHETYKVQYFIFSGISNSSKISFMYPTDYDDTLMPINLFQPHLEPDHLIFITNINYYFGAKSSFCLACKRLFKRRYNSHICKVKESCFTCRKILQSKDTFLYLLVDKHFCDKNLSSEEEISCKICNLPTYSERCRSNHKKICNGVGGFGFYCTQCKKFIAGQNSAQIKLKHKCSDDPLCKFCFKARDPNHLCLLKRERFNENHPRLAFLNVEFFAEGDPCLALIWRETNRCLFKKFIISDEELEHHQILNNLTATTDDIIQIDYLPEDLKNKDFQKKQLKNNSILASNISMIQNISIENKNCLMKLLHFLLEADYTCTTYICQDPNSMLLMTLLKAFLDNGICPNVIRKNSNIMVLDIPELSIRFINSNNYLSGDEYEIATQFDIHVQNRIYFPQRFLLPTNLDYSGTIPDLKYFEMFEDSEKTANDKINFVTKYCGNDWNLITQLFAYGNQKLGLLLQTMLCFFSECFSMQESFGHLKPKFKGTYISPIARPVCTLSGYVFKFFKLYFLNDYDMYAVNNEYGTPTRQSSLLEYQFTSYKEHCLKDHVCMSAFNNKLGQKYFRHCIPDLYSVTTNELFFLNGCFYHGHQSPACTINKKKTPDSPHPFGGTYKDMHDKFYNKLEACMLLNPEITRSHVVWECQFREMKKSPSFKQFYRNYFVPHPLVRLKARDSVRGALSDVYALKWSKKLFPNETFYCVDVNGLYSYCAVNYRYMVGKYDILIGKDINNLVLKNNLFYLENDHILGSMLLTILAPSDLHYPFLMYRKKNGSVVLPLCTKCAENECLECFHIDEDRALTGTYMISEVEFALTLGYKILHVHEVHYYTRSEYVLKDFVKQLNYFKLMASDCFKDCCSIKEKEELCNLINKAMDLNEGPISPSMINPNLKKRNFYKLMSNSLFGKFIQKSNKPHSKYLNCQDELDELFYTGAKIEDLFCISENVCLANLSVNLCKLPPNRSQNVYVGSQITAYAREVIYKHLMKLMEIPNCKIYQMECDSLFFSLPNNAQCNLNFSPSLGHFKHVYDGEILGFYSLGQKQYCVNYCERDTLHSIFKISGVCLKNRYNSAQLNENSFELFLDKFIEGNNQKFIFLQKKCHSDFINLKVISYQQKFTLTNKLSAKRFVNVFDTKLSTYPFGFKFE